jgi:hypothetical protein
VRARSVHEQFLAQDDTLVLGQGANLASSVLAVVVGVIILIATGLDRNIDAAVNKWLGYGLMVLALAALAVLRTDANYLNHTVASCVVTMILGLVLLTAGRYGNSAPRTRPRRGGMRA